MKLELVSVDRQKPPITLHQFPVIVGLDPGADICLDDSSVGHYQCMIDDSDGVLMIWDLGTKLGTTINGVRIAQKAPLRSGDELGIGKHRFVVYYDDGVVKPSRPRQREQHGGDPSDAPRQRHREPAVPV
jgi:pSer/pThr/pTyr-binding forkhead associated (FHA) protein